MESKVYWEYQVLAEEGWVFEHAVGQRPHHYESREEMMKILKIIHSGETVRIMKMEEIQVPG